MYYLDSKLTLLRRGSSLIKEQRHREDTTRGSFARLFPEPNNSLPIKSKGSVRKDIVAVLFESMLDHIIESWDVVSYAVDETNKEENTKNNSAMIRQRKPSVKSSARFNRRSSRSAVEMDEMEPEIAPTNWWTSPDEVAIISFHNGNTYEGQISMKTMHGEGRFQWTDGTVYMGSFKDNEMCGRGTIQWKDDTWYEGEFQRNIRHGKGIFVDSRKQISYNGNWELAMKHGHGTMYYTPDLQNFYSGSWVHNIRHGYGVREYCKNSGYKGEWQYNVKDGKGFIIWPNHDFYEGQWTNGFMSGLGHYIWDTVRNGSMSLPNINTYRGQWSRGKRHGIGIMYMGKGIAPYYEGFFKHNLKHGAGKLVCNNGLLLQDDPLFTNDLISTEYVCQITSDLGQTRSQLEREDMRFRFNICNSNINLEWHVKQSIELIDRSEENRCKIVREYLNMNHKPGIIIDCHEKAPAFNNYIHFEESSLKKCLNYYEQDLRKIYYKYATICNEEKILFSPVLMRLYLWQLFDDCNLQHAEGITLAEIDIMFHSNRQWLSESPHNPFEKIFYWQYLHHLIMLATKLYAMTDFPESQSDTNLAKAFRKLMTNYILPCTSYNEKRIKHTSYIPINAMYKLYKSIGEPHSLQTLIKHIITPSHLKSTLTNVEEGNADPLSFGKNGIVYGDEVVYFIEEEYTPYIHDIDMSKNTSNKLKLAKIGNISMKQIIKIISVFFHDLFDKDNNLIRLNILLNFYDFSRILTACIDEVLLEHKLDKPLERPASLSKAKLHKTTAVNKSQNAD